MKITVKEEVRIPLNAKEDVILEKGDKIVVNQEAEAEAEAIDKYLEQAVNVAFQIAKEQLSDEDLDELGEYAGATLAANLIAAINKTQYKGYSDVFFESMIDALQ